MALIFQEQRHLINGFNGTSTGLESFLLILLCIRRIGLVLWLE